MKLTTKDNHIIDFEYIPDIPVIVDAGSKDGSIIDVFYEHRDAIDYYIIEADLQHIPNIKKNFHKVYNYVLGGDDLPNEIDFYSYGDVGWGSMFWSDRRNKAHKHSATNKIKVLHINDIFDILKINYIDYLKLDIEGAEFNLFDTMTYETAERIKQISCEVHDEFQENGLRYIEIILNSLGYSDIEIGDWDEIWCVRK